MKPVHISSTWLLLLVYSHICAFVNARDNQTKSQNETTPIRDRPLQVTEEQWLMHHLLRGYDPNTRPVFNASDPVNVFLGITLTQIFDLDEKNQVLTTNVWLDQQWSDEKLKWNPEEFFGIEKLRIPCKFIWKPDIVLYNSTEVYTDGYKKILAIVSIVLPAVICIEDYTDGYMQSLAMVSYDGTIFWPPIVKFQSTCQIDITYFPFDDQICRMKLGSWAYDGFQVDVFNRSVPVDLSNYVSNGEWFLVSVTAERNVVTYPCCPEPFPDVVFTIHLRRRTLYYTHNVIIPCVMLSCLTLLIFWMSPDSGEKVTLGLTVLLAFSVFMLLIAENMPATSNFVPLIGMYLTTVMGITSLSVVLAVLVSNIAHKGNNQVPVPRCLHRIVLALARLMCVKLYYIRSDLQPDSGGCGAYPPPPPSRSSSHNHHNHHHHHNNYRMRRKLYQGCSTNHASNDSACGLLEYELGGGVGGVYHLSKNGHHGRTSAATSSPRGASDCPTSSSNIGTSLSNHHTTMNQMGGGGGFGVNSKSSGNPGGAGGSGREEDIDAVLTLLKSMLLNEAEKDSCDDLKLQWQEAAAVLDRFLFFLFLILTIVVTLGTLVVMPLMKPTTPAIPGL